MPVAGSGRSVDASAMAQSSPSFRGTHWSCRVWGHHVDNHTFRRSHSQERSCRCGEAYLRTDGSCTRVRHTLSCFLGHHTYVRMADRDRHHEYVCVQCGHPLVFAADRDPYAADRQFKKKVRYLCGLFGHRVHRVTARDGFVEYACHCGHSFLKGPSFREGPSFLKDEREMAVIRHPMVCVVAGHFVRYVASRAGYSEYVCRKCGHPFCFADPEGR